MCLLLQHQGLNCFSSYMKWDFLAAFESQIYQKNSVYMGGLWIKASLFYNFIGFANFMFVAVL